MKIFITGIGAVSALGLDSRSFKQGLEMGAVGIASITRYDTSGLKCRIAGEVQGYEPLEHFTKSRLTELDLYSQYALISAREAVSSSGLIVNHANRDRIAIIHGTGSGGQTTNDASYYQLYRENKVRFHPFTIPKLMPSAAASQISIELGITGPAFSTTSACASGAHAILMGTLLLRSGLADAALVGGAESALTYGSMKGWEALRIMSHETCRPFSSGRSGMVLGEGAATLLLETEENACKRDASVMAEVSGIGMSSDACSLIQPDVSGMSRSMNAALQDARLLPREVNYVNAHGTGTLLNDPYETAAVSQVFGEHSANLVMSSTKSQIGHTLGAAGALEAVATVIAIRDSFAPPTMGYLGRDPDCFLNYAPNKSMPLEISCAISNSFAFGGLNVSIVLTRV